MGFPGVIYGNYGDEKVAQSTKIGGLPLDTLMILPNGDKFRHAQASATAMVAGDLYMVDTLAALAGSAVVTYLTGMAVAVSAAVGATSVTVTTGGTASMTKDLLADGYLYVSSTTGAVAGTYRIKGNAAAASASSMKIDLAENDAIKVALAAGTTTVGVKHNRYKSLTLVAADTTMTGEIAGIAPVAVPASYYCWIRRSGLTNALTDNTLVVGEPVVASSVAAGAVGPFIIPASGTTKIKNSDKIGYAVNVSASAQQSLINLTLE